MTVEQIKKFVAESIDRKIKWGRIRLAGGEPILHAGLLEIVKELIDYKKIYSPNTRIQLITNGFGKVANDTLPKIPQQEVETVNSSKKSEPQLFSPFNKAPQDYLKYKYADYSNACAVRSVCGPGLTPYGYYPCAIAGSIDRIFGFDIGRKRMPLPNDSMFDQLQIFCKLCGHFIHAKPTRKEVMSSTWKKAYKRYKKEEPKLTLY